MVLPCLLVSAERILHHFGASGSPAASMVLDRSLFAKEITVEDGENGSKVLKGIRIFKRGTFKNSIGMENTWEDIHLDQMVQHFTLLRDGGFFPNVPVRVDHSWSVKDVVGYFKDVYRDTDDDQFLSADLEITEPDAYEKWKRGTYRSRSLEVGMYETNGGMTFFPVVFGLAFVDVPAVEGLHARSGDNTTVFFTDNKEQIPMGDKNENQTPEGANPPSGITDQHGQASDPPTPQPSSPTPTPQPAPAPQPAPPSAAAHAFRVSGQETTDFAAVQKHIDVLESTIKESTEQNRKDFVEQLAHSNKISAAQIEGLQGLVTTMTTEQYATFRDTYDSAPAVPGLAQHGIQTGGKVQDPTQSTSDGEPSDYETTKEIVQRLRDSGMSAEKVEATNAYKKLLAFESANK